MSKYRFSDGCRSVMSITSHRNAICALLRGLLPKECSQTSLDSAVCRCGRADSCAMVRPFAGCPILESLSDSRVESHEPPLTLPASAQTGPDVRATRYK